MRPVYIICGEGTSEDKTSNLVSIFHITEKITIAHSIRSLDPTATSPTLTFMPIVHFSVFAVWMKESGDEGRQFESQMAMDVPGKGITEFEAKPFNIASSKFLQRFRFQYDGPPFFAGSGLLRFISRVREVGAENWMSQDYPIVIDDQSEEPMLLSLEIVERAPKGVPVNG